MPRTRIISQSKALYVSPTGLLPSTYYGATAFNNSGIHPTQLSRIDTFSFDVDIAGARTDVREFGQLARIAAVRLKELTPKVTFGYYLTDGGQEFNLGLNTKGHTGALNVSQFISGMMTESNLKKEKNLYLLTVAEGIDAFEGGAGFSGNRANHNVIGFGNSTLNSYKASFKVGEIPRADVEMECGNIIFYTGQSSGLRNPAINRNSAEQADTGLFSLLAPDTGSSLVDVLRAGDMTVNFSNNGFSLGGVSFSGIHIQSLDIDIPLSRTPIERLGDELPFAKPLDFPINATCSINAFVTDFTSGSLQRVLTGCVFGGATDILINISNRCANNSTLQYKFVNAILDSQNFSMGLEDNETVDLTFSTQINGATSTGAGVYVSGSFDTTGLKANSENPFFTSGMFGAVGRQAD